MAYTKIVFQNSPSTATPLNAENLNHMDDQIALNDQRLTEIETSYVKSFNGRKGEVVPESGDYNIGQIAPLTGAQVGQVPVVVNHGTEEDPELVFEMGAGGGGGHSIIDSEGNTMPQETAMQFADSFVSDDDVNGRTVVENIKEHTTASDYDQATEDGFHVIDDGNDVPIGEIEEDVVSVTADGVKTIGTLLNELAVEVNWDNIKDGAYISETLDTTTIVYTHYRHTSSSATFYYGGSASGGARVGSYTVRENNSSAEVSTGTSYSDVTSTQKPTNGTVFTLHYGTSSTVINLKTSADYCMMSDGVTSVEDVLNTYKNITVTPDTSKITAFADFYAKCDSRTVELSIGFLTGSTLSSNNWVVIGSIPAEYAPSATIYFNAWDGTSKNSAFMYIANDGNIAIYAPVGSHNYYGFVSFLSSMLIQ